MKCDAVVIYKDGTWECIEDILFIAQHGDEVWLHKDHGAVHKCKDFVQLTIQPK